MIYSVFKLVSEKLNEHLKGKYNTPEDMVVVSTMNQAQSVDMLEVHNKMVLSLVNVERETAMGIRSEHSRMSLDLVNKNRPPWHLNLIFVVAAVFSEKQYLQSLKVLSSTLEFFQARNVFSFTSETENRREWRINIEPVNVNLQELTNLWTVLGGSYYPSMVGKIRILTIDANEVDSMSRTITETQLDLTKDE
ncbi:DUF4255 domain-containing protein [Ancylomarina sp. YFZ004]